MKLHFHLPPVTAAGAALHPIAHAHPRLGADTLRPYIGILGVLLGSILATLGSRVTTFGIADLRGGLHLGFDEGAWMTTSFGVGQMLVGVACPYFGVRRILLMGIGLFFIASLLAPLSPNLDAFLATQFLAGIGTGTFIPLTISFIAQPADAPHRLRHRGLCDEFRTVAECRRVARRLVCGSFVLALDRLAILRGAATDVRLHLVWRAAREDQYWPAQRPGLARPRLC
jgi:hypothetical protein